MKIRGGQTNNLIEQALIGKINEENIQSNINEIGLAFVSSGDAENDFRFKYKEELQECISKNNCTQVDQILQNLGNIICH